MYCLMSDKGNFEMYTGINREPVEVNEERLAGVNLGDLVTTLAREF